MTTMTHTAHGWQTVAEDIWSEQHGAQGDVIYHPLEQRFLFLAWRPALDNYESLPLTAEDAARVQEKS